MTHLLFMPDQPEGRFFLWGDTSGSAVQGSPALATLVASGEPATARVVDDSLAVRDVAGTAVALGEALPALASLGEDDLARAPASVAAWSLAAKLALDLISRERLVPRVRRTADGATEVRWGVALALSEDADRVRALAEAFPPAAHAIPMQASPSGGHTRARGGRAAPRSHRDGVAVWAPDALLRTFLDLSADAVARWATTDRPAAKADPSAPWEQRFVGALTSRTAAFTPSGFRERSLLDELEAWARPAIGVDLHAPRVCLRLELPQDGVRDDPGAPRGPSQHGVFPLRYLLQDPRDPSLLVPAQDVWSRGGATRRLGRTFESRDEHVLRSLAIAARVFPPIARSLRDAHPAAVLLDSAEAWTFIADAAAALAEAGIGVIVPAELTRSGQRRLRLRMRVGAAVATAGAVPGAHGFGLDALVDFNWEAAIGSEALSASELAELARLKAPLVRWRGRWIAVDQAELADVRDRLAKGGGRLSAAQAIRGALAGEVRPSGASLPVEVVADGAVAGLVDRLRGGTRVVAASGADGLHGTLREYQERGVDWLATMATYGLGVCLADDMGLGKTIQVLAYLLWRRAAGSGDRRPSLVVCPTSVVGNWEREIARFAPSLPVVRHYGAERSRSADALRGVPGAVVLTSYGLLRLDAVTLGAVDWDAVVLDEAQNIKNAASRTARAARGLRASHRLALTGTPVENRLAELWSILEFADPGLLGPLEAFRREFAVPVERYRDAAAAERLRRVVGPFILRRLKSDPTVIRDLPPKQEMKIVCSLTREQASLYQAAVDEALREIADTAGIQRRGRVLALLTALKQICDHPAHYLGETGPLAGRSGKLARLTEMLEEVVAAGERALVFTQFREMGERLVAHLERSLATEVLFLHGGVPRAARDRMTRRFQEDERGPRVFVLSLRAGGTGLNLTAASHVFHFDRWWNPAVEDQATDRAYRIGQRRAVQVHALLTAGTVEERVDRMLEEKRDLAARVVGAGERWITELDDASLRDLIALTGDAVVTADTPDREETANGPHARPHRTARGARRRGTPAAELLR